MIALRRTPWFAKPAPQHRRLPGSLHRRLPEVLVQLAIWCTGAPLLLPGLLSAAGVWLTTAARFRQLGVPWTQGLTPQLVPPLAAPGWPGEDVVPVVMMGDAVPEIRDPLWRPWVPKGQARASPVVFLGELAMAVPGPAATQFAMPSLPAPTGLLGLHFPAAI